MKIAIFGAAGAMGKAVAEELHQRGLPFRVVGRDAARLEAAFKKYPEAERVAADLSTVEGVRKAAKGVDLIFYTVGTTYMEFERLPTMMRAAVEGASAEGVKRMVLASNLYSYGRPRTTPLNETHPREPHTKKGRLRKEQEDLLMEAHAQGKLQAAIIRFPDFFGADAEFSFSIRWGQAAVEGGTADLLGNPDLPHEFIYIPDSGPVMVDLGLRDDVWGESYCCGGAGTISQKQFATKLYEHAGKKPKFRTAGPALVKIMGLFNPFMRELHEMMYQWNEPPMIVDDSKLRSKLGPVKKTSFADGIRQTYETLKARAKQ